MHEQSGTSPALIGNSIGESFVTSRNAPANPLFSLG
jgi:hypothetical protein